MLPQVKRCLPSLLFLGLTFMLCGCGMFSGGEGWKGAIDHQVGQLGYRNWIVVAESSFPAHNRPGTHQVNTYQPAPRVLDEVLKALESTEHVRPKIYLPREMEVVENDFAPGIERYREELQVALHGHETIKMDQDSIITIMQDARKSFDVLVLRSSTALPYSSIFLELQPGYWDGDSEARLRERMRRLKLERLASPVDPAQLSARHEQG